MYAAAMYPSFADGRVDLAELTIDEFELVNAFQSGRMEAMNKDRRSGSSGKEVENCGGVPKKFGKRRGRGERLYPELMK